MKHRNFGHLGSLAFHAEKNLLKIIRNNHSSSNKRHLRADVLSLRSSALRPRLLGNRDNRLYNVAKIVALSTILGVSGLFSFVSSSSVFADSLTLTIPSSPLSLDLNPTVNNGFATTSGSYNVKTDNSAGYTTSIKTKNESGNNSLINGNNKLTSILGPISEDTFKNGSEYINMWGWLPNKLNSEDNSSYQIAPGTEEIVLDKTEEASSDTGTDYNISLAAKVANDTPTGTYTNTFVVTALSNAAPQKEYEPTECWGLSEDQTGTFTDPRDGETYTIARLKDGKCWMTENLRITGSSSFQSGHSKTLTSDDSDLQPGETFELPDSDISKFNVGSNGYNTTEGKNNNAAYAETVSYTDSVYGAKSFKSGYYTWYTATAGTGTASMTSSGQNATSSICPKGWKLPTGGSGGDFQTLANAYSISSNIDGSNALRGEPLNFTYAGYVDYSSGTMSGRGGNGGYWSSTVSNRERAYNLIFTSSFVYPTDIIYRPYGHSVRCVAGGKKPEIIGTMQTVNQWGNSVQEGETVLATDERDNTAYTVTRLKDKKLWMTQNLRITGSSSFQPGHSAMLTADDSDITDTYTIPVSARWSTGGGHDEPGPPDQVISNTISVDNSSESDHAYYANNPSHGAYYTWYTATAGTGTTQMTTQGQNAADSICPKGWRLPTSGSDGGEFQALMTAHSITSSSEGSIILRSTPLNFTLAGELGYIYGGLDTLGSCGNYWSSTVYNQYNAYYMMFCSNFVEPAADSGYHSSGASASGLSVRCVARNEEITITYDTSGGGCNVKDAPDPQTVSATEDHATLSDKQPYSCPYTFVGWCTVKPDGESCPGQQYQASDSLPLSEDNSSITLYAIWHDTGYRDCEACPPPSEGPSVNV